MNDKQQLEKITEELEKVKISLSNMEKPKKLLFRAIKDDDLVQFNQILKDNYPDQKDIFKLYKKKIVRNEEIFYSPLFLAASKGSVKIVKRLLEIPGIQIDQEVVLYGELSIRRTPLGRSVELGYVGVVKLLLSHGANPDCQHWHSSDPAVTALVNMYKYRTEITKELHSWWYENITLPAKKQFAFFKENFPQDKADKLQVANLIIDVLEGKQDASVLNNLTEKQNLAINDGRLKVAFEDIRSQLPEAASVTNTQCL